MTLVKMGRRAQLDLLVFQELRGIQDLKERKVTEVMVIQDPVGLQGLLALQDPQLALTDPHLWTWRVLVLMLRLCGDRQVCKVHLVLPASPDPLAPNLQRLVVSGLLVHPVKMVLQVNRDFQVLQVRMENQVYLDQKEKGVTPVIWAYLDLWERRVPQVFLVPLVFQERVDLLGFQDQWDPLDHRDHLVPLAQVIVLVLMTWKALLLNLVQFLV